MQKLQVDLTPSQKTKSVKVSKKNSKAKNATKNNLQFAEIFGQLVSLLPVTQTNVKNTEVMKLKNDVSSSGKSKPSAEMKGGNIHGTISKETKSKSLKTEADSTASSIGSQVAKVENREASRSNGEVPSKQDTSKQKTSTSEIKLSTHITGSQGNVLGKSKIDSISREMRNNENSANSANSEFKLDDFMAGNNNSHAEKTASRPNQKELQKTDTKPNLINSVTTTSDIAINSGKNGKVEKASGKNVAEVETPALKTEVVDNHNVFAKSEVIVADSAETSGANPGKTILSKSQTDLIVSKMIEQIKVAPSRLEVSLKPEYLGKINILVTSNEGKISVNIIAQNGEVMSLLNSSLQTIRNNIEQQGIRLDQMDVNLANQEKQDNQSGSRYREPTQATPLFEKSNLTTEYPNHIAVEQRSLRSYEVNLLA
jgi:flagellar hook-length control protein FliK